MQATWMCKARGRVCIGRLLCLLCALLLLSLVGGCRDEGHAETAGREMDEAVEMASEASDGTLEKFEGEKETENATKEMGYASKEADLE